MTTEMITFSEYRKNLSTLWKKAAKENIKYLVMVHGKPSFEVQPVSSNTLEDDDWTQYTPENHKAWLEARKDLKKGDVYTLEDLKTKYL
ncbi:hypothetical protein CSB09_04540 [Candidatus Gracilibacteria bacterium]|nr:MAG: hypothetical protein CSB09_04540 [Candidatus Gracilibacteria bacterium]